MNGARGLAVRLVGVIAAAGALACDRDPDPVPPPAPSLLPADYLQRFPVVRSCRSSIEHDLRFIVIRAESGTETAYETGPFPRAVGTLLIKEEFSDRGCSDLVGFTLMRKEPAGYAPTLGDWHWQRLDAASQVTDDGLVSRCASCHAATNACRARDFACAEP